jgi:hypothetical protein
MPIMSTGLLDGKIGVIYAFTSRAAPWRASRSCGALVD